MLIIKFLVFDSSAFINQEDQRNTDLAHRKLNNKFNVLCLVQTVLQTKPANKKGRFSMKQPFQVILLL